MQGTPMLSCHTCRNVDTPSGSTGGGGGGSTDGWSSTPDPNCSLNGAKYNSNTKACCLSTCTKCGGTGKRYFW